MKQFVVANSHSVNGFTDSVNTYLNLGYKLQGNTYTYGNRILQNMIYDESDSLKEI